MTVSYDITPETLTVTIVGEIDHHSAKSARQEIDQTFLEALSKNITLDMSAVTFCDSSGLGLIMGRYKTAKENGGELYVRAPADAVAKMITLSGLDKLVKIVE